MDQVKNEYNPPAKKPYRAPEIADWGTVADLTKNTPNQPQADHLSGSHLAPGIQAAGTLSQKSTQSTRRAQSYDYSKLPRLRPSGAAAFTISAVVFVALSHQAWNTVSQAIADGG